ncbi:disulfide-isomerase A6 precursor [Gaeumannomyces tritici R3-111a-1]|uniref:protein disulfide-isomerase n=1 Tax=Gaeumannomyces tritici (strain R3-111a-1) TaxID=644352 RepID=J3NX63_GAET3|nr:disulfide-isomerase A6 precursor [Gaeumannomyces tritici R3-111a-1]EJT75945.1 disulfide-isomerase A6 precursor [Gaeumannomyces tritici R3-111a-1]
MHHPTLCAYAAALLAAALPGAQAGMYPKSSAVLQVNGKTYQDLVAKSNQTTILEFYAPWCGHCQNLKPAYEKAAKNLEGLAKVAAIDCDDDSNKPFCGTMGIQGFPTLKIIRPGKKAGKPAVEDYNGPRTAAGIVDAVVERMNNHVKRVTDKDLDDFLGTNEGPKAILFTDKGTTSALLKGVAIDFLDAISVAQIRNKETKAVEKFGIDKFPTLVLIPGDGKDPIKYDGPNKKPDMVKFLSQAAAPNPDPAPSSGKKSEKKKAEKKTGKDKKEKASKKGAEPEKKASADTPTDSAEAGSETVKAPVIIEAAPPVPTIHSAEKLAKECLNEKSNTCVLAFVPGADDKSDDATAALTVLAELAFKHAQSKRKLFPFFAVPSPSNLGAQAVIKALELTKPVELVAINARRGWWKHYQGADFAPNSIESWIDSIRLGEGAKNKLPGDLVAATVPEAEATPSPAQESSSSSDTKATDPIPDSETAKPSAHDEL